MIETVVVATDGSESVSRAVASAVDLAARFEAAVYGLYVLEESRFETLPEDLEGDVRGALEAEGRAALEAVAARTDLVDADLELETAVRTGRPAREIIRYAAACDADVVALGTRGRDGEHSYLLGSVAERVVRRCDRPVLTVRQLE